MESTEKAELGVDPRLSRSALSSAEHISIGHRIEACSTAHFMIHPKENLEFPTVSERTKIFISYAHDDGATLALRLLNELGARGYETWIDRERITGGSSWSREVERNLDDSDIVLALLSPGSIKKEICRCEQMRALRHSKCVIPLIVQATVDRPVYLESLHYLDFSNQEEFNQRMSDLEKAIVARRGAVLSRAFRKTRYDTLPPLPPNFVARPEELDELYHAILNDRERRNEKKVGSYFQRLE
jgi:hypothetical protein